MCVTPFRRVRSILQYAGPGEPGLRITQGHSLALVAKSGQRHLRKQTRIILGARASRPHPFVLQQPPSRPLVSFVDNPRHSNRPPVIPAAAGIQRGEAAGHHTITTKITVQTTPFAPLRALRGQSPSFQPPTRHSGGGRNPEGRGRGESHQSQKSHESQFRQPPSRPLVSFVDNPRHSNRPPVIPAAAGIQRGEAGDITPITKIPRITVQTTPFAPLRVLRGQSPSFQPPTRHSGEGRNPEGRGRAGHHTNHKNPTNHSSDNPLRALRGQSPSFQPPTRHSGGGRNPEGRGRGESHQSQKSHESQFRQLPSRPFVSFVDNPRHSNRPPVIPAAAGIQRGEAAGHPTNHKNPTNHSSDNPLRAP